MTSPDFFVGRLGSIREHLTTFRPPAPIASVHIDRERVVVQLRSGELDDLASALLEWADTLIGVTVTAWWPPDSRWVHLTVDGRLQDSTDATVYSGVAYTAATFGDLQPGGRHSVSLSVLRSWAADDGAVAA